MATISLGSKVAHGCARTVPPGESMLAEVQVLPRVPGPNRAVLVWGYFHKHTLRGSICHPLFPHPGTHDQLQFLRQNSGSSSAVASTTLGTLPTPHL